MQVWKVMEKFQGYSACVSLSLTDFFSLFVFSVNLFMTHSSMWLIS